MNSSPTSRLASNLLDGLAVIVLIVAAIAFVSLVVAACILEPIAMWTIGGLGATYWAASRVLK